MYTFPGMKKVVGKILFVPSYHLWHLIPSSAPPHPYLGADAGAVSAHPEELKSEDRHNMASRSGLEWGLATL